MHLEAEPEAIFFPKFENANEQSQEQYRKLAAAAQHVLVAAVKSSGSLFLATARAGVLVVASKNGMGNVYADCGHLVLIRHLQQAHDAAWGQAYQELIHLLEHHKLSLGCELVTRSLGDHAETPATDHLVVNAVLDRRTMAAVSPLLVLKICHYFGLVAPGMYMFKGPDAFERFHRTYESMRWKLDATWDELHEAMSEGAWRVSGMPYSELHSQNLEGYVCSWIPLSHELEKWARQSDSACVDAAQVKRPDARFHLNSLANLLPSLGEGSSSSVKQGEGGGVVVWLDEVVRGLTRHHPHDTSRQRLERLQPCLRKELDALLSSLKLPTSTLSFQANIPHTHQSEAEGQEDVAARDMWCGDLARDMSFRDLESRELNKKLQTWLAAARPSPARPSPTPQEHQHGAQVHGVHAAEQWGARGFLEMIGIDYCML